MNLYPHQIECLEKTKYLNKVAYFIDMGLGKTFIASEKATSFNKNILIICQKSLISMWYEHFLKYYPNYEVYDLTEKDDYNLFFDNFNMMSSNLVGIVNYDLIFRREELLKLINYTLILDESSLIQNYQTKRTKTIFKLKFRNIILLSGTPTSGKYENLWTQLHLLGYKQSKRFYEDRYINYDLIDMNVGFPIRVVNKKNPYKRVDELKNILRQYAIFMKTEDVIDLPDKNFNDIYVKQSKYVLEFYRNKIVEFDINDKHIKLVGDNTLNRYLYTRQLVSAYNDNKYNALKDLIDSTDDRLIIFYNWDIELKELIKICDNRPISQINGHVKDLTNYENCNNSITLCQHQSGSMGINLQKANKIIYFSPTDKCELYMQSQKRIHRIGQKNTCFYYRLISTGIEEKIYKSLEKGIDYTDKLFEEDFE